MLDAIVIGGGHNGLVCAAYLARAGHEVTVVEARATVGGCASTVSALGARVNVCNCDHIMSRASGVVEELDLTAHGLVYLDVEPHILALDWDGAPPWFAFHDVDRTLESLAGSYPTEVAGYRRYLAQARPAARLLLAVTGGCPTPGQALRHLASNRGRGAATIARWSRMSAVDVLRSFFSAEAVMTPALSIAPGVWGLAPEAPGTGLAALSLAIRHIVPTGRPVGGSGAFTDSIAAALLAAGGEIRTGCRVRSIDTNGERATGVKLDDGDRLTARAVVSTIEPRATFSGLLSNGPAGLRPTIDRWAGTESRDGYQSKIDAVIGERPSYRHLEAIDLERIGVRDPLVPTAIVSPSIKAISEAHALARAGRIARRPIMFVNVPSALDQTMRAPDGGEVLSLEAFFTPYSLGGGWPGSAEPQRWLDQYSTLVGPRFLDSVRRWRVVTPPDYEAELDIPRGYVPTYQGTLTSALAGRPRELTRYRTGLDGLYVSGAGTFPGAGIWGASGRNAAAIVDARLSRRG